MKTKFFLVGIFLTLLLLSPTYASTLDIYPNNFTLDMNISQTQYFSFRIIHTNESQNLTTPINIYYQGIIPLFFDKSNFTLVTSQNIYVNTTLFSNLFRANTYDGIIYIQTKNETHEIPISINIKPTTIYEFNNFTNMSLDQGENGIFYLDINNVGNTKLNLSIESPEFFYSIDKVEIYEGMSLKIPFFYNIPDNFSSGIHELEIKLGNKIHKINLTIIDKIIPIITIDENLSEEIFVFTKIKMSDYVFCEDNENVSQFTYTVGNLTKNMTDFFNFDEVEKYDFIFTCVDNYNNIVEKTFSVDSKRVEIKNLEEEILALKKKKDESVYLNLFSTSSKIKSKVELKDFNFTGGEMSLILRSGDRSFFLEPNNTIEFTTEGDVILQLNDFENEGNYKGTLVFKYEGYADDSNFEINFNGEVGSYSVREPFNLSVLDFDLKCYGVDTGSGSKVVCDGLEFPSDINPDIYVVPRTQNQLDTQEQLCQSRIGEVQDDVDFYKLILNILGVIVLIAVVILFLIKAKNAQHD